MKLHRFVILTVVVTALQATGVWAQVGGFSSRDARFLREAAQLGLFEFELGQLALSLGPTQELRDYGLLEAADHSGINQRIADIGEFHGIALPTTLTKSQQRVLDRLLELAETDSDRFVRELLRHSIKSHQRSIRLYQQEVEKGAAIDITTFALSFVGFFEIHLERALALQSGD